MKLLFDQNLSPRLCHRLADEFPGSAHVSHVELEESDDRDVWKFARDKGFTLVTKDADFADLVILRGPPPKVVWLRLGNCSTNEVEMLIRTHSAVIQELDDDDAVGFISLA